MDKTATRRVRPAAAAAVAVVVGLTLVGSGVLDGVVPSTVVTAIRLNSEAFAFFALVIVGLAEPRWFRVWVAGCLFGAILTSGLGDALGLPSAVVTLREPFVAALVVGLYARAPRSLRRRPWLYLAVVVVVLAGELPIEPWHGGFVARWIVIYAESAGMILLAALLIDVVIPWPRDLAPRTSGPVRAAGFGALIAIGLVLAVRNPDGVDQAATSAAGFADHVELWFLRNLESYIAVLLLSIWFSVRDGRQSLRPLRQTSAPTHGST